jgi:hypothetical protein
MNTSSEAPEGVDLKMLKLGSLIDVETKSRHYHIECLGGNAIRISGHPEYCPQPMPAQLHGSIDQERRVGVGLYRARNEANVLPERRPPCEDLSDY